MKIQIKSLKLDNFKGIASFEAEFHDKTDIAGANATGKTTLFDAFSWLLFDKDSLGRKDFGIKTYKPDGDTLHGVCHTVSAVLLVDGEELSLPTKNCQSLHDGSFFRFCANVGVGD